MKQPMNGFTVLEVMLALMLATVLLSALLTVAQSATATLRQAQALDLLSSTARHVHYELSSVVAIAGAGRDPIDAKPVTAVAGSRRETGSDVLSLQSMTPKNCFGNDNPVHGLDGRPAWWLQRNEYSVREGWRLVRTCYYGPVSHSATRQLNAATLVEGVETLRLRFGLDTDGDRRLDHWTRANEWGREDTVIGVRVGLVLATEQPVGATSEAGLTLFGQAHDAAEDGRARIAPTLTFPIRGRL